MERPEMELRPSEEDADLGARAMVNVVAAMALIMMATVVAFWSGGVIA